MVVVARGKVEDDASETVGKVEDDASKTVGFSKALMSDSNSLGTKSEQSERESVPPRDSPSYGTKSRLERERGVLSLAFLCACI